MCVHVCMHVCERESAKCAVKYIHLLDVPKQPTCMNGAALLYYNVQ